MKLILLLLLLVSCSSQKYQLGVTHSIIYQSAEIACNAHDGLRYIASYKKPDVEENPCIGFFKFRCEDDTLINYTSTVFTCIVDQKQLEEE